MRCRAEDCDNEVVRTGSRGRRPLYCSPACRPSAYKPGSRRRHFAVEVGHEPTEEGARPFGRVFHVTIICQKRTVVVASGLSRPAADHLAAQLRDFFAFRATRGGGYE